LIPPNGKRGSDATKLFTKVEPASSFLATRSPRFISFVNTAAPKPKMVSLAIRTASSSSLAPMIAATGPKSSSSYAGMPGFTSTRTVGG
jgi:hypothetical protein